jgi:thiosulfate/3-mercaptopyruvate sulfurtransferase
MAEIMTMQKLSPIIKADELARLMSDENLVIIDARTGPGIREEYNEQHLKGALFVDLETDLSKKGDPAKGGRHPLPAVRDFANLLGQLGIEKSSHVVVYDDKNGANAAARFWWMMRAVGHEKIQVLDGGLQTAQNAGLPITNEASKARTKSAYPAIEWVLPIVDINNVANAVQDPDYKVVDVREAFRYRGESEPIDTVAGHIPGAVNIPYSGNLEANGNFLSPGELATKYKEVLGDKESKQVIVHCGSGVTACHTLLSMDHAGFGIPSLYVGSWSEWSRNDRPVAKEK